MVVLGLVHTVAWYMLSKLSGLGVRSCQKIVFLLCWRELESLKSRDWMEEAVTSAPGV